MIDTQTDQILWSIDFPGTAIRPISFHTNPDGSTKWMFVNLNGLNGFVVVDFQTHEVIKTIQNPHAGDEVKSRIFTTGLAIPTHGVWVAPNQQTVWTANRWDNAVYAYSLPDLELMGYVPVGADPMWATFTADSKKLYVANNASGNVSVVDVQEMEEILRITVGQGPEFRDFMATLEPPRERSTIASIAGETGGNGPQIPAMTTDPITRLNAALEGRYRVEREIGEGGVATVYLAENLRTGRQKAGL